MYGHTYSKSMDRPGKVDNPALFFSFFHFTYSRWTSSLPSCLSSPRTFPSLPGSSLTIFYRDASSALLQLVNQWLNFTYSRSHALRFERKNTNPTLVRIELTTSALAGVQVTYSTTRATSAEQGKLIFPCPGSRPRIWSRETGSAVPSRVSLLIPILRLNMVLTYRIPPEFRSGIHLFTLNRHTPSGQSQVYRVTQLRTDGIHCRESNRTGPVNLKVVRSECCLGRSPWTN